MLYQTKDILDPENAPHSGKMIKLYTAHQPSMNNIFVLCLKIAKDIVEV